MQTAVAAWTKKSTPTLGATTSLIYRTASVIVIPIRVLHLSAAYCTAPFLCLHHSRHHTLPASFILQGDVAGIPFNPLINRCTTTNFTSRRAFVVVGVSDFVVPTPELLVRPTVVHLCPPLGDSINHVHTDNRTLTVAVLEHMAPTP